MQKMLQHSDWVIKLSELRIPVMHMVFESLLQQKEKMPESGEGERALANTVLAAAVVTDI